MVNLLYTELLKLKRAKLFQVSVIGAASAPIMMFISLLNIQSKKPDEPILFSVFFYNTNMYVLMLMGTLLYGVITAYLFNREYSENTLKNLLTIPVSKKSIIASKLALLLIWIIGLTLVMWGLTLILGLIGQFEGLSGTILLQSLKQYLIGGSLFFFLSMPTMLVTFLFKNFVPTIIFTAVITMANILVADSEYIAIFPWTAAHVIANSAFVPEYPPEYSYIAILIASLIGLIATLLYFKKVDIQ
ncbi:ABC transporter permease [Hazenella coriacea]|uniref:Bacitracin transport system permease protein n=1 Tax=Hazenella coriacea TaxID=1179467 RepID=A0A4R3L2V6_9BACL|nr:ABC transporter permease [Hazenella coriacea]TCS93235.1 bacitracin transport system permease protein [Hazenella coriacea]